MHSILGPILRTYKNKVRFGSLKEGSKVKGSFKGPFKAPARLQVLRFQVLRFL